MAKAWFRQTHGNFTLFVRKISGRRLSSAPQPVFQRAAIAAIATRVAPNYGLGSDVARSIVRKVLDMAAEVPESKTATLAADLARLKLENGKLKKQVATRERQRDALAAKILNSKRPPASKGRKAHDRLKKDEDEGI